MRAPVPASEQARLEALRSYDILDTAPDEDFDVLAALAARICGTPIALVSLVDADRQWFKARVGLGWAETPRDISFCAHAILGSDLLVVPDAAADARFADNPAVAGDPGIRFYAGAPLITPDGHALGTLCVLDDEPHELTPQQAHALRALSRQVVSLLELRRTRRELGSALEDMRRAEEARRTSQQLQTRMVESSRDCIKLLDIDGRLLSMNQRGMETLEICDFEPLRNTLWIDFWEGPHQEAARAAVETARGGGVGRFVGFCPTMTGKPMWWDVVVSAITDAEGRPERLLAVSRDVTDRVRDEETLRAIAEGTAATTGSEFFSSLVRHLASALGVRYAFVTECLDETRTRLRTLALWTSGAFAENLEYDLAGTPCQQVVGGEPAYHPRDLQSLFPADTLLADWEATSFLGLPMRDSAGQVIGHLAVLNDGPMEKVPRATSVLQVFAARAAAELERMKAERRRAALLEINNAIVGNLTRDALFRATTEALRRIVPFDRAAIFLHDPARDVLTLFALETSLPSPTFAVGLELPAGESHVGLVFRQGSYLLRRDLWTEREYASEEALFDEGFRSLVIVPLVTRGSTIGTLNVASTVASQYSETDAEFLLEVAAQIALAVENMRAYEEVTALKERLQAENVYLQEEIRTQHGFEEIIGQSAGLRRLLAQVEQVAPTDATVLVTGETGTGKELLARAIHELSPRRDRPLVVVNCGAISAGLVESELFGHEKGAFTGATARKVGRFELAHGGTIFLDEVGDLPLDLQVKLLRVLQEGEIERVGGTATIRVDVRIIAATHRDLPVAVGESRFRSDLYYRLNVFPIHVPALRERREDIPSLARYFLLKDGLRLGKSVERIPQRTMDALVAYDWPGNVRELRNVIERSIITSPGDTLELGDWVTGTMGSGDVTAIRVPTDGDRTLTRVERDHILDTLRRTGWVVSGPHGAARLLGLKPTTLEARMKKLGITRPRSA